MPVLSDATIENALRPYNVAGNPGSGVFNPVKADLIAVIKGARDEPSKDYISVLDHGAACDGVTDDTTAVQNAINASQNGVAVMIPGECLVGSLTCSDKSLTLVGNTRNGSRLLFKANAGLTYTVNTGQFDNIGLDIRHLGIQATTSNSTASLVKATFPEPESTSGAARSVSLLDVEIGGWKGGFGSYTVGVELYNATNLLLDNVEFRGNFFGTGLKIGGNEQPIDMYFNGCKMSFFIQGIEATGAGLGAGFEGLIFEGCKIIFCDNGIKVNSLTVHDYVAIKNCNINCFKRDIEVINMHNVHIMGNLLYSCAPPANADHVSITLLNTDVAFTVTSNNIIVNNSFFGAVTPNPPAKTAILIDSTNSANTATLIDANFISDMQYGLDLESGANNVTFTDTNRMVNVGTPLVDNSGQTSNIFAQFINGTNEWFERNNFGVLTKGGNGTYTITSNKVTIPINGAGLGGAFKTEIFHALAINQFPGALPNEVISFDRASSTTSSLVFHCGTTASGSIQIAWECKGV